MVQQNATASQTNHDFSGPPRCPLILRFGFVGHLWAMAGDLVNGASFGVREGGPQYGQVAVSALGSGRACPATVIDFCPSCQRVARPLSVRRTDVHPSTLPPLAALAFWALLG